MTIILKKLVARKIKLSDIVSPKPSIGADIVISGAMKQAHKAQEAIRREAYSKS